MRLLPVAFLVGACASTPPPKQPAPAPMPPPPVAVKAQPEQPMPNDDEAARFAELLTADAAESHEGDLGTRREGASLRQQIDDVKASGGKVAIGNPGGAARTGTGKVGTGAGPGAHPAGPTTVPAGPSPRVSITNKAALDKTTLTSDVVLAKIQAAYMPGVKRCYKNYLNKDPTAKGRMVLKIPVNETGRVVGGSVTGFSGEVNSCVTGLLGMWRFPGPKDDNGDAAETRFEISLQMVPD